MNNKEIENNIIDENLFNEKYEKNKENIISQYELLVNSAHETSNHRENTNKFYLTMIAALFTIGTYLSTEYNNSITIVLLIFIIIICIRWRKHLQEYKMLNSVKFKIINNLELYLPVKAFTTEWKILKHRKYSGLTEWNEKIPLWLITISVIWISLIIIDVFNIIPQILVYVQKIYLIFFK